MPTTFRGAVRRFVGGALFNPQTDPVLIQKVADLMAQAVPERALTALAELNRLDYATLLPAVTVPLIVIDSDLGGAVDTARLRHSVAQLQVISLPGDDSFPMLDDVPRFNTALLQATDSLAAQPARSGHP